MVVGDRVRVRLQLGQWRSGGWFEGTIVLIDPYSAHRSFHWVKLDVEVQVASGGTTDLVAVLNPRNIMKT